MVGREFDRDGVPIPTRQQKSLKIYFLWCFNFIMKLLYLLDFMYLDHKVLNNYDNNKKTHQISLCMSKPVNYLMNKSYIFIVGYFTFHINNFMGF